MISERFAPIFCSLYPVFKHIPWTFLYVIFWSRCRLKFYEYFLALYQKLFYQKIKKFEKLIGNWWLQNRFFCFTFRPKNLEEVFDKRYQNFSILVQKLIVADAEWISGYGWIHLSLNCHDYTNFFVFHSNSIKLGEVLVHIDNYNFTNFYWFQMKNKKVF